MSIRVRELMRGEPAEGGRLPGLPPSLRDLMAARKSASTGAADAETGPVVGMFLSSGDATAAEICAGAGFDYLLIDGEHSPLSLETIQGQLRAVSGCPTIPVVRVPANDEVLIKQYLDLGAQSLIVPMVDTVEQAQRAARAVAYPSEGIRGVGAALARSARWGRVPDYLGQARRSISLIVQAESATGIENIGEIAAVDGVDGIFVGPSDLSASMGLLGQQTHPEVVSAVKRVIDAGHAAHRFVGVNAFSREQAQAYADAGADFVNVTADVALLARAAEEQAAAWGLQR